jgi:hypothetical protein
MSVQALGGWIGALPQRRLWGRQGLDRRPPPKVQSAERGRVKIRSVWRYGNRQSARLAASYSPFVYPSSDFLYVASVPASCGGDCMAGLDSGARACGVRQADKGLAYEVGAVHDYFWHRRHRARRGGQLVDVAILVAFAAVVSCWALILHH